MSENQKEVDFFNSAKDQERSKLKEEKQQRYQSFLKIGKQTLVSLGIVAVLGGGSVFGYKTYQAHIDDEIKAVETTVKSTDRAGVLGLIDKEKTVTQQTYAKNQLLINDFARYKDLIEVINFSNQVAIFNTNNAKLYKDTMERLNGDFQDVSKAYNALNGSRDDKIAEYLNSQDVKKLGEWNNNYQNKQFMYVGGLINLNKDLVKQLEFLDKTQAEIIENVQQRLKNKDYDLNAAQTAFTGQVNKDAQEQIDDLKNARLELEDTKAALKENDEDPNQIANILTDADVTNASDAMDQVKQEANNQITSDRAKVEALIAQANANNGNLPTQNQQPNTQSGQQTTVVNGVPTTQVVHVHSGPTFLDYYLMYSWMNSGSSTTVVNNYNTTNGAAPAVRSYRPVQALSNNTPYSIKNENSYLNKTLTQKADLTGNSALKSSLQKSSLAPKANINTLRAQIQTAKARAAQVRTTRASELSRMGYANSYEAGKAGTRGVSSKSSIATSRGSIARGSFGGHSGGFGG